MSSNMGIFGTILVGGVPVKFLLNGFRSNILSITQKNHVPRESFGTILGGGAGEILTQRSIYS